MPRAGLECRHESLENHRDRHRCRDCRDRTAAGDRDSLQLPDLDHPGAGRATDRLSAGGRGQHPHRGLAVAQRDPERRHAAGPERPRQQRSPDRDPGPGRHHPEEPVVGAARDHRTRHRPPDPERAVAARTQRAAFAVLAARGVHRRQRRPGILDRSRHGERRHHGVFQSARPRRESHRGHRCHRRDRGRPRHRDHRSCPRRRAAADGRDQGGGAASAAGAAEHSGRPQARGARRAAKPAVGQGRAAAQRCGGDDQRP